LGSRLHNYHDIYRALPINASWVANTGNTGDVNSALITLLPFMEQQNVHEAIIRLNAAPWLFNWDASFRPELGQNIATLLCPSDGYAATPGPNSPKTNMMVCFGDVALQNARRGSQNTIDTPKDRGVFTNANVWKNMSVVQDGTSNTIALGEAAVARQAGGRNVLGNTTVVTMNSGYSVNVMNCMNRRDPNNPYMLLGTTLSGNGQRGWMYGHFQPIYATFATILPPNSPNCAAVNSEAEWGVYSGSSYHPGGMNVCMTDGSVHFISETIDCGGLPTAVHGTLTQGANCQLVGPSPYGVWGALGTPAGGESPSSR